MAYVLGIGGTTRTGSSSERALRFSLDAAKSAGAEVCCLVADDLDLPLYAPESPIRSDRATRLVQQFRRCDGLIVCSPGYHGTVSGMIKNALDYVEDLRMDTPAYLDGRPFGTIGCAYGWAGAVHTVTGLRSIAHALRAWPTPMGAAINTDTPIFDDDGRIVDPKSMFQLEMVGRQVVEFATMRAMSKSAGVAV
jgi:FMN reductase